MKIATILLVTALISASGAGEPKPRFNRVSFGPVEPGQTLKLFLGSSKGYKKSDPVKWIEFVKPDDVTRIWTPVPADMPLSQRALGRIPVIEVSGPEQKCGSTPRLVFLAGPPERGGSPGQEGSAPSLFAYEHIICDTTGLVPPDVMVDQYIAKYGMYDAKDYDRNQVVYNNVRKRYRVGVRPFVSKGEGPGGIVVTVVDEAIFREKYLAWRATMQGATRRVQRLF